MKRYFLIGLFGIVFSLFAYAASGQCSICSRTAAQMGAKPARGLNTGILYLAAVPFVVVGLISYRWWRDNNTNV